MGEGLFIIRAVLGALLFAHGCQKLFGWWGGHGLEGTGGFFHQLGHRPGRQMAGLAGMSEAGGGALLFLGLHLSGWGWGLLALVLAGVGAAIQLSRRKRVLAADATASEESAYPAEEQPTTVASDEAMPDRAAT